MSKNDSDNLYKILKIKEDCSSQEIKNAYIALSKKYHPDINKAKDTHEIYLKINDAYSVLGKPGSRRIYDQYLANNNDKNYHHYYENVYTTRDEAAFAGRKRRMANSPYYSIKGLKKVSNSVILLVCFAFATIGVGIEFLALRKSLTYGQEKQMHDSSRNQIFYEVAKKEALANGNKLQIEKLQENALRGRSLREVNEIYAQRLLEKDLNESVKH